MKPDAAAPPPLGSLERYGAVLLDLDGTVYLDRDALPGARDFVLASRAAGLRVGFVTNMAFEDTAWCVEGLRRCGIPATPGDVVTAADSLALALSAGGIGAVAYVGGVGLRTALDAKGIDALEVDRVDVDSWARAPADGRALAIGMTPGITSNQIDRLARLAGAGFPLYVSSVDRGMPTKSGIVPGAAAVLAELRDRVDVEARVCGKTSPEFASLVHQLLDGTNPPLVVGDSLEADVVFAAQEGFDSLLVLTGVSTAESLGAASVGPTYCEPDLASAYRNAFGGDAATGRHESIERNAP
ncbi:HAD-type sugar phosphatase [Gaiella occulta]|uniref:HAD-type sugar phosphatase n=1 Tax=Gaiella occulta TaxID=1002870 RepID=A0A7M2YW75_9ACTN|nr:HAD hydrolase-like protein [Gaiella occulta]RDI74391.1 HAD-type sugar phosphatase [Gaiella occulta]